MKIGENYFVTVLILQQNQNLNLQNFKRVKAAQSLRGLAFVCSIYHTPQTLLKMVSSNLLLIRIKPA